jgi:hypothetical protein
MLCEELHAIFSKGTIEGNVATHMVVGTRQVTPSRWSTVVIAYSTSLRWGEPHGGAREGEPWGEESPGRGHTSYPTSDLTMAERSYVQL